MTSRSAGIEIPVPEPELAPAEMLARARSLREQLRARSRVSQRVDLPAGTCSRLHFGLGEGMG